MPGLERRAMQWARLLRRLCKVHVPSRLRRRIMRGMTVKWNLV